MTLKRKVRNYFKKMAINIIRAQEYRAAEQTAAWLIANNDDFRGVSSIDLTNAIRSKKQIGWKELGR